MRTPVLDLVLPDNPVKSLPYLRDMLWASFLILDAASLAPTITDFTNAQHTHQNAVGGGVLDAAAIVGNVTGSGSVVKATSPTLITPTVSGDMTIEEVTAGLNLFSSALAADEKRWVHNIETNNLVFRAVSDDSVSSSAWLTVTRSGTAITGVNLQTPTLAVQASGATAAATGLVRMPNNQSLNWRNAGNTADIGLSVGGSNEYVLVGATVSATVGAAGPAAALPASPNEYLLVSRAGTVMKIPMFAA